MNLQNKLDEYNQKLKDLQQKITEDFNTEFHPMMLEMMGENIVKVSWQQYTPYFNDGATCYFSVYADDVCDVMLDDKLVEEVSSYDSVLDKYPTVKEQIRNIEKFLYSSQNVLERVFGDHKQVIITKEGIETEEYDHD